MLIAKSAFDKSLQYFKNVPPSSSLVNWSLAFLFQHEYGYVRDETFEFHLIYNTKASGSI